MRPQPIEFEVSELTGLMRSAASRLIDMEFDLLSVVVADPFPAVMLLTNHGIASDFFFYDDWRLIYSVAEIMFEQFALPMHVDNKFLCRMCMKSLRSIRGTWEWRDDPFADQWGARSLDRALRFESLYSPRLLARLFTRCVPQKSYLKVWVTRQLERMKSLRERAASATQNILHAKKMLDDWQATIEDEGADVTDYTAPLREAMVMQHIARLIGIPYARMQLELDVRLLARALQTPVEGFFTAMRQIKTGRMKDESHRHAKNGNTRHAD